VILVLQSRFDESRERGTPTPLRAKTELSRVRGSKRWWGCRGKGEKKPDEPFLLMRHLEVAGQLTSGVEEP